MQVALGPRSANLTRYLWNLLVFVTVAVLVRG